jgi:TetR/AcrR family tetracycline transcriptional repressor
MARTAKSPNLTYEAVIEAAARVLEREGYAGLTMRSVAAELKVQAPALYWYVASKDVLELALYDHLMRDLVFAPVGDDWREDVRRMSQALRIHLVARRDIGKLLPNGFFFAPNSVGLMDLAIGVLLSAGIAPRDAFYAFTTSFAYVANWAVGEAELASRPVGTRPGLDEESKALLMGGAYPAFAQVAQAFLEPGDIDEQFAFGLDCLIAGFERLIPAS